MNQFWKKIDVGNNVHSVIQDKNCMYMSMKNETGEGSMTCYNLFPGIVFMYCDYHMEYCESKFQNRGDLFCIDYCLEGSFENEIKPGVFVYQKEKELNMNTRVQHTGIFSFPQRHFHGITICFSNPEADASLRDLFEGMEISVADLKKKFCSKTDICIIKPSQEIQDLFEAMRDIPDRCRIGFMRVKIVELLLKIHNLHAQEYQSEEVYLYKAEVEKIKAIRQTLVSELRQFYTIEELSLRFAISKSSLKNGFKILYGCPIYTYMKRYRMNYAAIMLMEDTKQNISNIAALVGYDNASKFSAAFTDVLGMTPSKYRRKKQ